MIMMLALELPPAVLTPGTTAKADLPSQFKYIND